MLNKLLLLSAFIFIIFSCGTRENETDNEQYTGVWNWVSTDGGIGKIHLTPANSGINRTLTMTAESVYTIKENEVIISQGTYYVGRAVTNTDHLEKLFLHLSEDQNLIIESFNSSDLYLSEDHNDGLKYHYSK